MSNQPFQPTASSALLELFHHSKHTLRPDQLNTLAHMADQAACDARHLSAIAELMGHLHIQTDETFTPSPDKVASAFFELSERLELVAAMTDIADEAAYLLQKTGGRS